MLRRNISHYRTWHKPYFYHHFSELSWKKISESSVKNLGIIFCQNFMLYFYFFLQLLTMRLVNMVLDNYKAYNPEPLSYSIKYAASHFLSI